MVAAHGNTTAVMLLGCVLTAMLLQQVAAGPRVDAALESATNVKPGDLRAPTASGLPPEEHDRLIAAMKDWQDTSADMSKEMFLHKYGSRLTEDPHTLWNKLDLNGDSRISGKVRAGPFAATPCQHTRLADTRCAALGVCRRSRRARSTSSPL